jgi:hypothetical protein
MLGLLFRKEHGPRLHPQYPTAQRKRQPRARAVQYCTPRTINLCRVNPGPYSVVVKNRAPPPKSWTWEIYQAGRTSPIEHSSVYFQTMTTASRAHARKPSSSCWKGSTPNNACDGPWCDGSSAEPDPNQFVRRGRGMIKVQMVRHDLGRSGAFASPGSPGDAAGTRVFCAGGRMRGHDEMRQHRLCGVLFC